MKRFTVTVTQTLTIELDKTKFTPEFMAEYRRHFFPWNTLERHAEHLGQLYARGLVADWKPFIEGYGEPKDMGISCKEMGTETEAELEVPA